MPTIHALLPGVASHQGRCLESIALQVEMITRDLHAGCSGTLFSVLSLKSSYNPANFIRRKY